MLDKKAGLTVSALIHPKGVEVRTLCRPVQFLHPKLTHLCLYGPCFVDWSKSFDESGDYGGGLFFRGWVGPLVPVKGTLKASAYQDILDNFMLPTL